mmetsp:Transcript_87814/g.247759  ORF Transcript_87814/g.247759 Transcript_87814/m.247759 type:complete len:271 (+) Transcript_87814:57-869(+)
MSSAATFAAGVLGSLSADTLLHPVDNFKCQIQTAGPTRAAPRLREMLSLCALYRGYPAVVLAGAPGNGIFFVTYEALQRVLEDRCSVRGDANYLLASGLATVAATSLFCPMEVVKETAFAHRISSREAMQRVYADRGLQGFFRGWSAGVATWVPYLSIYYVLYERLRERLARLSWTDGRGQGFATDLAAGLTAASVAATVTYPLDTVKTRLQSGVLRLESGGLWRALRTEAGLFSGRGLALRVLWLAPGSALNVSLYERYSAWLGGLGAT